MEIRLFQILGYNVCMYRNLEQIKGYFTVTFFFFFCRQGFLQIRPEFNCKELKSVGHYQKLAEKGPKSGVSTSGIQLQSALICWTLPKIG